MEQKFGNADWSDEKNRSLRQRHGVGFEDVVVAIAEGRVLIDRPHPNAERYGHQRQMVVEIGGYAYAVPYVETEGGLFFKTLYPSRQLTKHYLRGD